MSPELAAKRPTVEQVDQIRRLSTVALGDAGAAFEKWGYPSTRAEASEIIRLINLDRSSTVDDRDGSAISDEVPDEKTCPGCRELKPSTDFYSNRARSDGLTVYCKTCSADRQRRRMGTGTTKEETVADTLHCKRCDTTKPLDDFAPSIQKKGGGWCRNCMKEYSKERNGKGGTDVTRRPPREQTTTGTQGRVAGHVASTPPTTESTAVTTEVIVVSSNGDWRAPYSDPSLSQLKILQSVLGIPTLDETAELSRLIATGGHQ